MKKLILSLVIGIITTICINNYTNSVQADLANNMVRFHVIANSDSYEDQQLKLYVRDKIINDMKEYFDQSENIDVTKELIENKLYYIEEIAINAIKEQGKDYNVKATIGTYPFPTKAYGDVTLPAGNYEALRVVIGNGIGQNWWCVLFPPLCFVDAIHGEIPDDAKQTLKNVLTEDEYKIITTGNNGGEIPVQIKFKVLELWQNSRVKIQTALNKKK